MSFTSLSLKNFRSYRDYTVDLGVGVNIIVGPNGSGKTNLLEGLFVLARGKSFRVSDAELLRHGTKVARVAGVVDGRRRQLSLRLGDGRVEKRWKFDGTEKLRLMPAHKLKVVLFEPRDMQLLTGSPDQRRLFMDEALEQLEPAYGTALGRYRRALAQRNALLKQERRVPADHFFVWNVRLSELGAQIIRWRRRLTEALDQRAAAAYGDISGVSSEVKVVYGDQTSAVPDDQLASALLHALEERQEKDLVRGFTSVGPHRDDMMLKLNGTLASTSASRGETRSLVVMLKLLEAQLLQARHDELPLVLLDDVFGELDRKRRQALARHFVEHQVVITSTDAVTARGASTIRLG